MITRRVAPILVFLLSACDPADSGDADCEPSDEIASLALDNRSGVRVEMLTASPCDGSGSPQMLTLPSGGVEFSAQATVELPGQGCWLLSWSGEGCSNDPPYRTSSDVCGGETYAWTIAGNGLACEGGW